MHKKRMLILCPFPVGVAAGQRLKYEQYISDWESEGWEVEISPFMDIDTWNLAYKKGNLIKKVYGILKGYRRRLLDLFKIKDFELVYVFLYVTPFFTTLFERLVRKYSKCLIYDIEDNLLNKQNLKLTISQKIANFVRNKNKAIFLIRNSNHVITSSPFLNDDCLKINKNKSCTYITASVNTNLFFPINKYINEEVLTIGWTGTFSSMEYLKQLNNVFLELSKKVEFKLRIIGNFKYLLPGINLEVINWTKEKEVEDMQGIDIGVYPLPNNEWVFGKSGLKAIQYMAFGIPCVASNIGNTPYVIKHRYNGILVKTEKEWVNSLKELIMDPKLRKDLGRQARKDAIQRFSNQAVSRLYNSSIEKALVTQND